MAAYAKEDASVCTIGSIRTESTPVEIEAATLMSLESADGILCIKASSVYELRSQRALMGW